MVAMKTLVLGLLCMLVVTTAFNVNSNIIAPRLPSGNPRCGGRQQHWASLKAPWNRAKELSSQGRTMSMSSAEGSTITETRSMQTQSSGGGGGFKPPDEYEQAEAEMVDSSTATVFVAGGSGFVGSEICSQLVEAGCNVIALSRSGAPTNGESWAKSVKWVEGNALAGTSTRTLRLNGIEKVVAPLAVHISIKNQDAYRAELRKSDTVISCVGGFGKTDAYMELVNGEANIKLAEAAADAGVKQFVFVSVHDYKAPQFVKRVGYFDGKRRTEKTVGELFGSKGVILKPALIYGERKVNVKGPDGKERKLKLPLQRIGGPLAKITSTGIGKKIAESGLPLADVAWTQPLSTDYVAKSAVRCCLEGAENLEAGVKGRDSGDALVLRVQDMVELVASQT